MLQINLSQPFPEFRRVLLRLLRRFRVKSKTSLLRSAGMRQRDLLDRLLFAHGDKNCLVHLVTYGQTHPTRTVNSAETLLSPHNRRGKLLRIVAPANSHKVSLFVVDDNVVVENGKRFSTGGLRTFSLTDPSGNIGTNWSTIELFHKPNKQVQLISDGLYRTHADQILVERLVDPARAQFFGTDSHVHLHACLVRLHEEYRAVDNHLTHLHNHSGARATGQRGYVKTSKRETVPARMPVLYVSLEDFHLTGRVQYREACYDTLMRRRARINRLRGVTQATIRGIETAYLHAEKPEGRGTLEAGGGAIAWRQKLSTFGVDPSTLPSAQPLPFLPGSEEADGILERLRQARGPEEKRPLY